MKILSLSCRTLSLSLALGFGALLQGCGSGGSDDGSDFGGPAQVEFRAGPSTVDTGDRVRVEIKLSDIHDDGILLKVSYPTSLAFVEGSGELTLDDDSEDESDLVPVNNVAVDNDMFLVFSLPQSLFDEDDPRGTITFELQALKTTERATIGIDPDVDSTTPFNPDHPEYAAEDEIDITVRK